jgi:16S rRNA (adenine1518-N6/adenine1519-N6)-dimethyltransferase
VDRKVADRIVDAAEPGPGDVVLEVGPGLGILTGRLVESGATVIAVEIEPRFAAHLGSVVPGATVLETDVLDGRGGLSSVVREALDALPADAGLRVIANLPYSVATPLVQALLDRESPPRDFHVMVQREVADRLAADPGSSAYGVLSVVVQVQAEVSRVLTVGAKSFHPVPAIASAVVRITPRNEDRPDAGERRRVTALVHAAFGRRRKTLSNALKPFGITADALEAAGVDPRRRGETLSPSEFRALARSLPSLAPDPPASDTGAIDDE